MNNDITKEYIESILDYNSDTGDFIWKSLPPKSNRKIGQLAGSLRPDGYTQIGINKKVYFAHRLAFLIHYGFLPETVDHINGIRGDNRISNLRSASYSQNNMNKRLSKKTSSGLKGVVWDKNRSKWKVSIHANNETINAGRYDDINLAKDVSVKFRNKMHGNFANHGDFKS